MKPLYTNYCVILSFCMIVFYGFQDKSYARNFIEHIVKNNPIELQNIQICCKKTKSTTLAQYLEDKRSKYFIMVIKRKMISNMDYVEFILSVKKVCYMCRIKESNGNT